MEPLCLGALPGDIQRGGEVCMLGFNEDVCWGFMENCLVFSHRACWGLIGVFVGIEIIVLVVL